MCRLTNEDERQSDTKGQDVPSEGLVVFAITFGEHAEAGIDVVFAERLRRTRGNTSCATAATSRPARTHRLLLKQSSYLKHFGSADQRRQGRGQRGREDSSSDDGPKPRNDAHHLIPPQRHIKVFPHTSTTENSVSYLEVILETVAAAIFVVFTA